MQKKENWKKGINFKSEILFVSIELQQRDWKKKLPKIAISKGVAIVYVSP